MGAAEVAQAIDDLIGRKRTKRPVVTKPSTTNDEVSGGSGMVNPMNAKGQLIKGGTAGAPVRVPHPAAAGKVLASTVDDVEWADATSLGQYRFMVLADDGSGGWGFVTATIGGQTWPVTSLADLE